MDMWIYWIIAAIILGIFELFSPGFFIIFFSAGALVAAILSAMNINLYGQIFIFLFVSITLLIYMRPIVSKISPKANHKTNLDSTLGAKGTVLVEINPLASKGQIKLKNEIWSATSIDNSIIEVGAIVEVKEIKGVTAIVEKIQE